MENYVLPLAIGVIVLGLGIAAYVHLRRHRQREVDARGAVSAFLTARYGMVPADTRISCSHDLHWPVLAFCTSPSTGVQHRLQFAFAWLPASLLLIADDPVVR